MLTMQQIKEIFDAHFFKGMGSVNILEVAYIQNCIAARRPEMFVEVGVASGMSSGFIGRFLSENGGKVLHSIDVNERYYADTTKPTGYLFEALCPEPAIEFNLHLKKTAFDVGTILAGQRFDMAFIDANHMHPWPTIDTMAMLPYARKDALILHHDISLYTVEQWKDGIGPKHLFDQFYGPEKNLIDAPFQNIGYIVAPSDNYLSYEPQLLAALEMPWTAPAVHPYFADRFRQHLKANWSPRALDLFDSLQVKYGAKSA